LAKGGTKLNKPDGYVGTLAITWESGEKNVFEITQSKGHIWVGEHSVSSRNEKNIQGVLREISEVMSYPPKKIKQYTWLELVSPIQFPKY
jgi:hypothetical protein